MRYALESRHPDFPAGCANGTSGSICPSLCFVSFCFVRLCEVTVHFSVPLLWRVAAGLPTSYQVYMCYNPIFSHTKQVWWKGLPKDASEPSDPQRSVIREVVNLIHNNIFILQWPEELTFTEAYICTVCLIGGYLHHLNSYCPIKCFYHDLGYWWLKIWQIWSLPSD